MVQKWGIGGLLIVVATVLYFIGLFFPWSHVLFMHMNGFQHDGYIVLLVFAYPLYTVFTGKSMVKFLGLGCSILAVILLLYYMIRLSEDFLGTSISTAGLGLYVAMLAAIILLVGTIIKIKK